MPKLFFPFSEFDKRIDRQLISNYYEILNGIVPANSDFSNQIGSIQNYLVNGSLLIWQEDTSFSISTGVSGDFLADFWRFQRFSTNNWAGTISQSTTIPAGSVLPYSIRVQTSSNSTSTSSTSAASLETGIPPDRINMLGNKKFFLSFWHRSGTAGTFFIYITDDNRTVSYVIPVKVDAVNQWKKETFLIDLTQVGGFIPNFNSFEVSLFSLRIGFVFSGRLPAEFISRNVWLSGSYRLTDDVNGTVILNNNDFFLHDVRMTNYKGIVDLRSFQQELELCKKAYYKTFDYNQAPIQGVGTGIGEIAHKKILAGAQASLSDVRFPYQMYHVPAITFYNPINLNALWYNNNAIADSGTATANGLSVMGFRATNAGVAGDQANQTCIIHFTADARLT